MVAERRDLPIVTERPWVDPWCAFLAAEALPGRVLLDSGGEVGPASRWSVLAVNPLEALEWRLPARFLKRSPGGPCSGDSRAPCGDSRGGTRVPALAEAQERDEDPFDLLEALQRCWAERLSGAPRRSDDRVPDERGRSTRAPFRGADPSERSGFTGGTIAAIGYDASRALERLPVLAKDDPSLPDLWAAVYDGAVLFDRLRRRVLLTSWFPEDRARVAVREELLRASGSGPLAAHLLEGRLPGRTRSIDPSRAAAADGSADDGRAQFLNGVRKIKEEIERGEIYQANLTRRIVRPGSFERGSTIYERLRRLSPTPFAAYVDAGTFHLLSASPERLLRITHPGEREEGSFSGGAGVAETRPIKGTRPRGSNPAEDAALKAELLASAKDRAELLMIVDLERNDLGRVCRTGTIEVQGLPAIEGYSTIWHLVATVRGQLDPEVSAIAVLRALFPGGSITGAPKIRAMEILETLEAHRRKFAMGSLVAWDFSGELDSSILIRTMALSGGRAVLSVGGGIVADSSPDAEYDETVVKAAPLLAALEEP